MMKTLKQNIKINSGYKVKPKCNKECKLDETRQFCTGCLRTMEEIVAAGLARKRSDKS